MNAAAEAQGPQVDYDALLRVYAAAFRGGYVSALMQRGIPPVVAHHFSGHVIEGLMNDPIARNVACDMAAAAFLDDAALQPPNTRVNIDIKGCGE